MLFTTSFLFSLFLFFFSLFFFYFNAPATPEIYTLPLHDALPISMLGRDSDRFGLVEERDPRRNAARRGGFGEVGRSEEHTSELQSRFDLVCRLLLEKKKKKKKPSSQMTYTTHSPQRNTQVLTTHQ